MIEDLTKTQLVLLTLLISFVTSIATGIIASSLLQVAPPTVVQTIDRVVEKTTQLVSPDPTNSSAPPEKVTTVVVQEEDQVLNTISKNTPSVVRISDNTTTPDPFYAIGVILTKDGLMMAPLQDTFNAAYTYTATLSNGKTAILRYMGKDKNNTTVFFRVATQSLPFSGTPVDLASDYAQLGQTAVSIEGETQNVVTVGRVTELVSDPNDSTVTEGAALDVTPKTKVIGAPILSLSGELLGMRSTQVEASGTPIYISPVYLKDDIAAYKKQS